MALCVWLGGGSAGEGSTKTWRAPVITEQLVEQIAKHEGLRTKPYRDTVGVWTVGYGHNLNEPITEEDARQILISDIKKAINDCVHAFPWFMELNEARQYAVIDMAFNLGINRLRGFRNFLLAMELGDYDTAANHMLDSLWAKQVKGRALELATMIRGSEQV